MTESPEKTTATLPNRRSDDPNGRARRLSPGATSIVAVVAGVIAIVAAVLTPFLPVTTTTATITWPQGQQLGSANADITSPLVAQMAQDLDVTIPCSLLRSAPADASSTILTTMPPLSLIHI